MKYQNKKTGTVIEVNSEISGGDWQEFKPAKKTAKGKPEKKSEDDTADEVEDE